MSVKMYKHNRERSYVAAVRTRLNSGKYAYVGVNADLESSFRMDADTFEKEYTPVLEAPKPIIELLPHEFVKGQEVLFRNNNTRKWCKGILGKYRGDEYVYPFKCGESADVNFKYCIPYVGNEHLEGTITEGKHGAVPEDYVSPRVPKLGDDDYWMVGDEVIDLASGQEGVIKCFVPNDTFEVCVGGYNETYTLEGKKQMYKKVGLRVLYHKGSYVREDGTVHEYVPTRAHRIEG